jgi:hypothetical protein
LYADQDLKALWLACHHNAAAQARDTGLILPAERTLASTCYSLKAALFGHIDEDSVVAQRLGPNGELEAGSITCTYKHWLPNLGSVMAAPLMRGDLTFGVVIVGWGRRLQDEDLRKKFPQVAKLCQEASELAHENRLDLEANLREALTPHVQKLRRIPDSVLAPEMPVKIELPPEIDQVFPAEFRSAVGELLSRAVRELQCLSATLRLADDFCSALFLIGAAGRPGNAAQYSLREPSSVSAYCFLNVDKYDAISLPLIRGGKPFAGDLYPGLIYANAREETRSQLCLPLVSKSASEVCIGTLNFESAKEHGFQNSRGACAELRDILEDIVDRRKSSAHGELLRHIDYMGHLFAQEHHALKDHLSLVVSELLSAGRVEKLEIQEVVAKHSKDFAERIRALDTLGIKRVFDPAPSVDSVLARVSAKLKNWLEFSVELTTEGLAYGNPHLFERAVENTLWQVVAFLRNAQDKEPTHHFRVRVILRKIPDDKACLLAISHNGPAIREDLAPFLFWYRITSGLPGTGMGLALTGFEYRSMDMYARASSKSPVWLKDTESNEARTWFTIHIPLR